jgi:hypothetical protein
MVIRRGQTGLEILNGGALRVCWENTQRINHEATAAAAIANGSPDQKALRDPETAMTYLNDRDEPGHIIVSSQY